MTRINILIFVLGISFLFSCKHSDFISFENNDQYFQLIPKGQELLNAVNTQGDGEQKLQLYNAGSQKFLEVMMPNIPFTVTNWEHDTIKVEFFISDTSLFYPWFRENKSRPETIDVYKILYSVRMNKGTTLGSEMHIDSLSYDKSNFRVKMYSQGEIVYEQSLQSLHFFPDKVDHITPVRLFEFYVKDKELIGSFLQQLGSDYVR